MTKMIETNIPFSGFYHTYHSDEIDREVDSLLCTDHNCTDEADPVFSEVFWGGRKSGAWADRRPDVDYSGIHERYGREFAENYVLEHLDIPHAPGRAYRVPRTGAVESPREYNFATDRVFIEVEARYMIDALCRIMWDDDALAALKDVIRERFTSRSGFMSHYPNDLADWPEDLDEWDHNHWGTVVAVYAKYFGGWDNEDYPAEVSLVEDAWGNGFVSGLVWEWANEDALRLFELARKVGERREREAARRPHTGLEAARGMVDAGAPLD